MPDQALIDILQSMARQRGRAEQSPLLLLRMLEAREGARISHLPIHQTLEHAWVAMTGEPFRPHQSLALASLRRGEPFALVGGGAAARRTLYLLLHDILHNAERVRVLFLVPDEETATHYLAELEQLSYALGRMLQATHISTEDIQPHVFTSRVLFLTPDILHRRLLRHYNRAWRSFWNELRLIFISDMERYHGVAAEHLAALLLRSTRLTRPDEPLYIAATLAETSAVGAVLSQMSNQLWRVITVDDVPLPQQVLGVWQAGPERLADATALALAYRREGYTVHIIAAQLEIPLLQRLIRTDDAQISVGHSPHPADVQIIAGYPGSHAAVRQALSDGVPLTLLLLGNAPAERTLARLMRLDKQNIPVLDDPPTTWALPTANAYVSARHLLCAATELPLTEAEVNAWQARELIERLERQGHLVCLPDGEATWQPLLAAGDPYDGFGLQAAGTSMALLYDEDDILLDTLDPAAYDRWGFTGAALPMWYGSLRVVDRDEAEDVLLLKAEQRDRSTFPLRRCNVEVRDERKQRYAAGTPVGYGRVLVEEEIYGYREVCAGSAPAERVLTTPLATRWTAPATWVDLHTQLRLEGQLCGWSLVAALPLRVLCRPGDCVPAYDADKQRLYFIDAQPGGNGLAAWLYDHLEQLLPLAYDVAHDSRNDGLLEPLARTDMDWMLTMLGGKVALPEIETPVRAAVVQPLPQPAPAVAGQSALFEPTTGTHDGQTSSAPAAPAPSSEAARSAGRDRSKRSRAKSSSRQATPQQPDSSSAGQDAPEQRVAKGTPRKTGRQHDGTAAPAPASEPAAQPADAPPAQGASLNHQTVPPAAEPEPDPWAILKRLRQRQSRQQQAQSSPAAQPDPPQPVAESRFPTPPRFGVGDQVICLPYGYGVIQSSRIEDGHEILSVSFSDYGEIIVDPAINMVRLVHAGIDDDGDVL